MKLTAAMLLLLTIQLNAQTFSDPKLEWNEFYKLTWEDFQGVPNKNSYGDAATSVQIKATPFYIDRDLHYDVLTYFNRKGSWARDTSASLLAHEQMHFDLAELYARKVRKEIKHLREQNVSNAKTINEAVRKILEESDRADAQYDAETLHGSLPKKQKYWREKIQSELAALETFKKPRRVIGMRQH